MHTLPKHVAARFAKATGILEALLSTWGFTFVLGEVHSSHCGPYATGAFIRDQTKISLSCRETIDNLTYEQTFITKHLSFTEIERYEIGHAALMKAIGHADDCQLIAGYKQPDLILARDGSDRIAALVHDLENYAADLLRNANDEFYKIVRRGYRSYSVI